MDKKPPKLYRLLPLFQSQEALLTWGLVLLPEEYKAFSERPSWPAWRELMVQDLSDKLQTALDRGELRTPDLYALAEQSLSPSEMAAIPVNPTPPMLAAALFDREPAPESQVAMIRDFLDATIKGDAAEIAQLVEAAQAKMPPTELSAKALVELAPVERVMRVVSAMSW